MALVAIQPLGPAGRAFDAAAAIRPAVALDAETVLAFALALALAFDAGAGADVGAVAVEVAVAVDASGFVPD